MSFRHLFVTLITFATTVLAASPAEAGFGDWLFGRTPSPYVAGYAPTAVTPAYPQAGYQTQMPPTYDNASVYTGRPVVNSYGANRTAYQLPPNGTVAPVSNWTPVNPAAGYSANFGAQPATAPSGLAPSSLAPTPWTVTNTTVGPPVNRSIAAPPSAAAPALSYRPSFGRPNVGNEVPIARALRGANATSNPFYGTGNVYPNTFGAVPQPYAAGYGSSSQITPAATLNGPPVDPLFPNAPRPRVGGLARFFGSLLGTNYQSSYYRAPITYYRPMTGVDPVTGTTVTTQQACSSYVQQLQRTPYNSFQPGSGLLPGGFGNQATSVTPVGPPVPCGTGGCGLATNAAPQTYAPSPYGPNPYAANPSFAPAPGFSPQPSGANPFNDYGAIGQASGTNSPSDRDVIPIPSTDPRSGYYQQNTQPLTGRPESSPRSSTGSSPNGTDRDNVPQPRLESARPSTDEDTYRDGLYRRDVTPFADEDFKKQEPVDQSSYYQSENADPSEASPLDLNGPLGNYRMQPRSTPRETTRQIPRETLQQRIAPRESYTQLAPATPRATFRAQQPAQLPVSRPDESAKPADVPPAYSTLRPIPDPNPEPSPFRNRDNRVTQPEIDRTPRYESNLQAPKLPPATEQPASTDGWYKRGEANSASARASVPVREANLSLKQFQREPAPAKSLKPILRDSEGWLPL